MSLPKGIFPAGKVFHVPPPAVEASALPDASGGTGCAGNAGTGVATGGGGAAATRSGGVATGLATAGACDSTGGGGGGFGGADAAARAIGVGEGVADCLATTGGGGAIGAAVGVGAAFWPFASFPPFGPGIGLPCLSSLTGAAGGCTATACSTRTNSFWAGGGVTLGARPGTGRFAGAGACAFCCR